MMKMVLLVLLMAVLFYGLYQSGYMFINSKSAVSYIGSQSGNAARFTACNGSIKRILRFKADGSYRYSLNAELSAGDLSVELLDASRRRLLLLDRANPSGHIQAQKGKKYYLVVRFQSATGRYQLVRE